MTFVVLNVPRGVGVTGVGLSTKLYQFFSASLIKETLSWPSKVPKKLANYWSAAHQKGVNLFLKRNYKDEKEIVSLRAISNPMPQSRQSRGICPCRWRCTEISAATCIFHWLSAENLYSDITEFGCSWNGWRQFQCIAFCQALASFTLKVGSFLLLYLFLGHQGEWLSSRKLWLGIWVPLCAKAQKPLYFVQ